MKPTAPFTPESLLEFAASVPNDRFESESALAAAAWMEANGKKSLRFVGPYGDVKSAFRRGQTVTIPKGTPIHRPTFPGETHIVAGRTYSVVLHDAYIGFVEPGNMNVHNPRLTWPGTGGYWYEVDPNDIVKP